MANTERQRLLGWLDALPRAGITPAVVRLPHGDSQETGDQGASLLLARKSRPQRCSASPTSLLSV